MRPVLTSAVSGLAVAALLFVIPRSLLPLASLAVLVGAGLLLGASEQSVDEDEAWR